MEKNQLFYGLRQGCLGLQVHVWADRSPRDAWIKEEEEKGHEVSTCGEREAMRLERNGASEFEHY